MIDILDITNITDIRSAGMGKFVLKETGCPLERHPDWILKTNAASNTCWKDFGTIIQFKKWVSGNFARNLSYKNLRSEGAILEFDIIDAGETSNWALPAAKFLNDNNIVGARLNDGKVQIVQRKVGTWSTLGEVPGVAGHWIVTITNNHITVNAEGTDVIDKAHTITGEGWFGISSHRIMNDVDMISNFSVVVTRCEASIGGADGTEWKLDGTLFGECKICKS